MTALAGGVATTVKVEIWSDVVCPWCYIGKRRFDGALSRFAHRDQVEVVWRSFELDPSAPRRRPGAYAERLADKYRVSVPEARASIDHIVEAGQGDGLVLDFDIATPGNTFDAHRMLHLAHDRGMQNRLKERLLAATFTEGAAIGEVEVLAQLAVAVGLDPNEVETVLAGDAYAGAVRADEQEARRLGITAVPFFVIAGTYGVAGAHPSDVLLQSLEDAWSEADGALPDTHAAPACLDDTCDTAP